MAADLPVRKDFVANRSPPAWRSPDRATRPLSPPCDLLTLPKSGVTLDFSPHAAPPGDHTQPERARQAGSTQTSRNEAGRTQVEEPRMAKALIGHVGGPDTRVIMEMRRLQERVRTLETEVLRLRAENDRLAAGVTDEPLISLDVKEPALA
jgi:hypothetical protein